MYQTHQNCLLCGSEKGLSLNRYSRHYLVKCKTCGFVFCNRIPTMEELLANYNRYPRGSSISPITIKRYNELLDSLERYRHNNKLLDIGCGDGCFLEIAKKRNWEVYGTEFTDDAVLICKNKEINIVKGILNPDDFPNIQFDVITSFEVMEHIYNPQPEINNIDKLLRNGGAFYFTTPNFNSISRHYLGPDWTVIGYPEHLLYYTVKTIKYLLNKKSWGKKFIKTTGISLSRWKTEKGNTSNNQNIDEAFREKSESKVIFKLLKLFTNYALNITRLGDTIKVLYEKQL